MRMPRTPHPGDPGHTSPDVGSVPPFLGHHRQGGAGRPAGRGRRDRCPSPAL